MTRQERIKIRRPLKVQAQSDHISKNHTSPSGKKPKYEESSMVRWSEQAI